MGIIKINSILLLIIFFLTGCAGSFSDNAELNSSQQEYILSKVNNYNGLIKLYREKLSQKEDKETRYRLAEYYYLSGDFDSARQYLQPLINNNPAEKVLLLQSKNLMELGNFSEAKVTVAKVLKQNPKNGEAWNIQGVLLAQSGDFAGASSAFNSARQCFVDDDIVINNLAMLAIMQNDYQKARDYLLSLYNRGHTNQKILHNLVYVMVKLGDVNGAESIMQQEKMADNSNGIIEALSKVNPRPHDQLAAAMISSTSLPATSQNEKKITGSTPAISGNNKSTTPMVTTGIHKEEQMPGVRSTGLSETASLSQAGDLKEIYAVRSGRHPGYFRMTLESRQLIEYREIPGNESNKRTFELQNVKLGPELLRAATDIPRAHSNISKLTFYQNQPNAVLVEFEFTRPLIKTNVFRVSNNKTQGEKLVFDIYNG